MAVPPNPFSSSLNLGLPQVSQVTDPTLKREIDAILNAIRLLQQYVADTTPP